MNVAPVVNEKSRKILEKKKQQQIEGIQEEEKSKSLTRENTKDNNR